MLRNNQTVSSVFLALLVALSGCAGEKEGVCIYTESDGVYAYDGSEVCTDGLSQLGCDNAEGTFTAGTIGDAPTVCPEEGFSVECATTGASSDSTVWAASAADCGDEGDDTGT